MIEWIKDWQCSKEKKGRQKKNKIKKNNVKDKATNDTIESELNYADIDIEVINKKITIKRRKTRKKKRKKLAGSEKVINKTDKIPNFLLCKNILYVKFYLKIKNKEKGCFLLVGCINFYCNKKLWKKITRKQKWTRL